MQRPNPYRTLNRERAALYLRECLREGRRVNVREAVRRGVGCDPSSARRIIRWVVEREINPLPSA